MNRKSSRVVVIKDEKLLVMFRNKFGAKYVTLPGGRIEIGETAEQAAVREALEETSIKVKNPRLVFIDHADFYGDQFVFLCDYVSGEPALSAGSTELEINKLGKNLYEPGWLSLKELSSVSFVSDELRQEIIKATTSGWPDEIVEFYSKRSS